MRICYFGTYRADYARNRIMIDGLRSAGHQVEECHEALWRGIEDRVEVASGGWTNPRFWWRVLRAYVRLLRRYTLVGSYDVLVVGYPGQFDVFLARVLAWIARKPLVWDVFMSIYLIAVERGLDSRSPSTMSLIRSLERIACRLPNLLILDTRDYASWFEATHGIRSNRFQLVPTGADNRIFAPAVESRPPDSTFRVVYHGTFIPNHGVLHIVEAARLVRDDPTIQFELIGTGPDRKKAVDVAQTYGLTNVTFVEWLDKAELVTHLREASVCLGVFGTTPQSLMTIQNKIYESLAIAKPVISGESPAVRAALQHGKHIYLCRREDSASLAAAIRTLRGDPELCKSLSQNGYAIYAQSFTVECIGVRFGDFLQKLAS